PEEVEEAVEEGVRLVFLAAPLKITTENGKLIMECIRMKLGAEDPSGRRRPEPLKGSEYKMELDNVISAVSQSPIVPKSFGLATDKGSRILTNEETLATAKPGIFAGGDV